MYTYDEVKEKTQGKLHIEASTNRHLSHATSDSDPAIYFKLQWRLSPWTTHPVREKKILDAPFVEFGLKVKT